MAKAIPPTVLAILDGWGLAPANPDNSIAAANTPVFDALWKESPHAELAAYGEHVGLTDERTGNSEVGHVNLGAGRIVLQDQIRINAAIADGSFYKNAVLHEAIVHSRQNGSALHLMGMISDGGVHSDLNHLFTILELLDRERCDRVYLHLFTDGQDTPPRSALGYLRQLRAKMEETGCGRIASVTGRFYAMERALQWGRTQKVYDAFVHGADPAAHSAEEAIEQAYAEGLTDEDIPPTIILDQHNKPIGSISDGDAIIFWHLRSDRARHLTKAFVQKEFRSFPRRTILKDLYFATLTEFGNDLPVHTAFVTEPVSRALPDVLDRDGITQLYVAESEKYAHMTYFFHGFSADAQHNEDRVQVASPDTRDYNTTPKMSAAKITKVVLDALKSESHNFIGVNYANADVLGHTGDFDAAVKGIGVVDKELGKIVAAIRKLGGNLIITADHGNAERMRNPKTGERQTSHTTNPVPLIVVTSDDGVHLAPEGILGDVAPTILDLLGLEIPKEMTGRSLVLK